MVIGFLGKGGSGKSTLSSRFVRFLTGKGARVLAVDADHNMDLTYNFGVSESLNYLGNSLGDLVVYAGLDPEKHSYRDIFLNNVEPVFRIEPPDFFTARYSYPLNERTRLMTAGPHTESVLYGKSCSHVLSTALKVYLPFLSLNEGEYVVVDEKAGSDGVGTGIASGFDIGLVALEPTEYGIKAAHQIADLLEFFGTPYEFVGNKLHDENDRAFLRDRLRKEPLCVFFHDPTFTRSTLESSPGSQAVFQNILDSFSLRSSTTRKERSKDKFLRNEKQLTPEE